jgi:hypothetical protein
LFGGRALHPALEVDLKLNASILLVVWQLLCRQILFSFGFCTQMKGRKNNYLDEISSDLSERFHVTLVLEN